MHVTLKLISVSGVTTCFEKCQFFLYYSLLLFLGLGLGALVKIGLDVELCKEAKEDEHEDAGDQGELPGVSTLGISCHNQHALDEHHSELEKIQMSKLLFT